MFAACLENGWNWSWANGGSHWSNEEASDSGVGADTSWVDVVSGKSHLGSGDGNEGKDEDHLFYNF